MTKNASCVQVSSSVPVICRNQPKDGNANDNNNHHDHKQYQNDLLLLRAAAAREITGAVYHYFKASSEVLNEPFEDDMTYQEYFAHEANDEMLHYLDEIRMISKLDPTQKAEFIEHELGPYLVGNQFPPIKFWYGPFEYSPDEREARWHKTIEHVIESINFELETISVYQQFIAQAKHPEVIKVFKDAMDHEKGDLADFNQMLFKLLYSDDPYTPDE